jgi:hypothetical protein
MIITYFDGLTIWDYPDGAREARLTDGEYLYLADDGSWQVSDQFEWPPIPLFPEWTMAQITAEDMLQAGLEVVGYELIADVPTAHLQLEEDLAHLWVDETGAVIRLVVDYSEPDQDILWFAVWDVETLSPDLTGPIPDEP